MKTMFHHLLWKSERTKILNIHIGVLNTVQPREKASKKDFLKKKSNNMEIKYFNFSCKCASDSV